MKPAAALQYIARVARRHGFHVTELPGRGKGSHRLFTVVHDGAEVARFGLTGHGDRELSWTMMRQIEDGLAHLFGEKWMEKR